MRPRPTKGKIHKHQHSTLIQIAFIIFRRMSLRKFQFIALNPDWLSATTLATKNGPKQNGTQSGRSEFKPTFPTTNADNDGMIR